MEDNPWKFKSTRTVYKNSWMSVREDKVVKPSGNDGIYAFLEKGTATGVVALTPEHSIYLVGQYRYPMQEYSWEIIEGGAEPGETVLAAAQRELAEEAGIVAKNWQPLGGEVHLSNCVTSERGYLFLATDLTKIESSPEETEVLQLRLLPLAQALAMTDSGEIKDSMSIIALLRLARLLKL